MDGEGGRERGRGGEGGREGGREIYRRRKVKKDKEM